jgi:hypothetical protein
MICGLHPRSIAFNGHCWLCRKAELYALMELDPNPLVTDENRVRVICRLTRFVLKRKKAWKPIEAIGTGHESDGLVPFEEIGQALGVSAQRAQQLCVSGLKKLRKNPVVCRQLLGLANWRSECLPRGKDEGLPKWI